MQNLAKIADRIWYHQHWAVYFLVPFAFIFKMIVSIRRCLFRCKIKKVTHFSVPVIVVGNITVGGTGKTPLVIELVKCLQQQGFKPGIVSRGYKGKAKQWPQIVRDTTDPYLVGDEAVLLAKKTFCPVVVAPDRVAAVSQLLQNFACDIVISDDGLQHYALARDIEIAVIDNQRQLGNGYCLPAGPLREPRERLQKVDLIISHMDKQNFFAGNSCFYLAEDRIYPAVDPQKTLDLAELKSEPIHAVAGIGNPEKFFRQLEMMGLNIIRHVFPDHYYYQAQDINFGENAKVIMTEKDAVKCQSFVDRRHFVFAVRANLSEKLKNDFLKLVQE